MSWYVVTCRLAHDDEDSCLILRGESWEDVTEQAHQQLREEAGEDMPTEDDPTEDNGGQRRDFYVNWVVKCGEEKPVVELCNAY